MIRTTMEWPLTRYPEAQLADAARVVAFTGEAVSVLPAGLETSDRDWEPKPVRLRSSVSDSFDHFRVLVSLDEAAQPAHLLDHVKRFGAGVLCRDHDLPMWHTYPERTEAKPSEVASCRYPGVPGFDGCTGLRVEAAVRVAQFLDALLDASVRIRRRQPLSRNLVHGITEMPFVPISNVFRAEFDRDGKLSAARQRQLVSLGAESFLRQTLTSEGVSWIAHRRPELVMKCQEVWGVYGLETVRRLSLDDERPGTYRCEVCDTPVLLARRSKDGELTYCRTPEGQRERWRRNKARQRNERKVVGR